MGEVVKHPVKRNRARLRLRAARWKASKADSVEDMALRVLTGRGYAAFMGKGRGASYPGILEIGKSRL